MNINFFDPRYVVAVICDPQFGIMDNCKAHIVKSNVNGCNAVVKNNTFQLNFVPIDNHIKLLRKRGQLAKRFDCMLYDSNKTDMIIFIELKRRKDPESAFWDGKEQLKETITFFTKFHSDHCIKGKYSFIANALVPFLPIPSPETIIKFKDETGFILHISNIIDINDLNNNSSSSKV